MAIWETLFGLANGLALVMWIGNYNGYRLTELIRFRAMFEK